MRKYLSLVLALLTILLFCMGGCNKSNNVSESLCDIEYRTDLEPIINRFPMLKDIKSAYWKPEIIGNSRLGPSLYSITGFFILSDDDKIEIESNYNFDKSVKLTLPNGIETSVTGFSEFEWFECSDFSKDILNNKFVGSVCYDMLNGIIFLDVQNT